MGQLHDRMAQGTRSRVEGDSRSGASEVSQHGPDLAAIGPQQPLTAVFLTGAREQDCEGSTGELPWSVLKKSALEKSLMNFGRTAAILLASLPGRTRVLWLIRGDVRTGPSFGNSL